MWGRVEMPAHLCVRIHSRSLTEKPDNKEIRKGWTETLKKKFYDTIWYSDDFSQY